MRPRRPLCLLAVPLLILAACENADNPSGLKLIAGPVGPAPDTLDATPDLTVDYFIDLAFGNEYGPTTDAVRKWLDSPTVELIDATSDDLLIVDDALDDIRAITGLVPTIVSSNGNIRVFFVKRADFDQIADVPTTVEGATVGLWDQDFFLLSATVLVDDATTGQTREHVIREELAQAFGLLRDSWRVPGSIFYRGTSGQTAFSDLDEDVLALLYSGVIRAGMTQAEVIDVLGGRQSP